MGWGKELGSLLAQTSGIKGTGEGRGQSEGAGASMFGSESPVSVCSAATTESHRPGGLEAEIYFSQFWRAEVQGQVPAWAGEGSLQGDSLLAVSSHGQGWESHMVSFGRALTPFMRASPSRPIHLPEG